MEHYAQSSDHLLAELERIDLMIRSRVAHLRRVQSEDEHFRGLYISEQEIDALLERPVGQPQWLYDAVRGQADAVLRAEAAARQRLATRPGRR